MPEAGPIRPQLERSIQRLEAMRRDLEARSRPGTRQDALFVGLTVADAGLQSLGAAVAAMREAYHDLQPHPQPKPGWFIEVEGEGADVTG